MIPFQHTAARRRLPFVAHISRPIYRVSTHSRPKAAAKAPNKLIAFVGVSTHSRPKAAAKHLFSRISISISGFNTQPPEGGCFSHGLTRSSGVGFQHTAARRRLRQNGAGGYSATLTFQHTAARRRLPQDRKAFWQAENVSTHSRPKAAAPTSGKAKSQPCVSTHSRPKAAASM